MTIFSRDSDLTTSPRDEDMLKKDVDMFIHKLLIIKFNHIPNYARLLVRRLWDRDQCRYEYKCTHHHLDGKQKQLIIKS